MHTTISGTFVKIAFASDASILLARGVPHRPAARFNREGQDALYLSPDEESARVAIGEYVKVSDPQRILLRFDVTAARLVDLRHPNSASIYANACQPWQSAIAKGLCPPSWTAADELRQANEIGLIDPSRRRPGLWHITLFRWNEPGAPSVVDLGEPKPIELTLNYR